MNFNIFKKSLEKKFLKYASEDFKTIALPEAEFSGIIVKAAQYCTKKHIANIVLIGDERKIKNTFLSENFDGISFIDPKTYDKKDDFAKTLYELRKDKGLTLKEAKELVLDPIYFATMLLHEGIVDGVVGGAATTTANMLRPALQIIKTEEGIKTASSSFIVLSKPSLKIGDRGVFVLGDCAVNVNPDAEQLADIALATAKTATKLAGLDPRMAMLSYSTQGSGEGESVDKVKKATDLIRLKAPELFVEGELQADSALLSRVARVKVKNNNWKGNANVLIFPDLNSGNIGYKLMKIAGKMKAIGPIMQGLKKPVNDLSRGASLREAVLTIAITCLQVNNLSEEERIEKYKREKQERLEKIKQERLEKQDKLREERLKKEAALEEELQKQEEIKKQERLEEQKILKEQKKEKQEKLRQEKEEKKLSKKEKQETVLEEEINFVSEPSEVALVEPEKQEEKISEEIKETVIENEKIITE